MINPRVTNVRNVAPNKDMYRVSFKLSCDIKDQEESQAGGISDESRKKQKVK
jgi:hypothetical protein